MAIAEEIYQRDIAYDGVAVAGLKYRTDDALDFIEALDSGQRAGIRFEREPDNEYDPHALKIIGWWADQVRHVGYVPAVLAELIAFKGWSNVEGEVSLYDLTEQTNRIVLEVRIFAP